MAANMQHQPQGRIGRYARSTLASLRRVDDKDAAARREDLKEAAQETRQLLRWESIKDFVGLRTEKEARAHMKVKLFALEGFMEGIDANQAEDPTNKAMRYLIARRLFENAMTHIEKIGIGRINEVKKQGYRKYLAKHHKIVKDELGEINERKINQILADMEKHDPSDESIAKASAIATYTSAMRKSRINGYKFTFLGAMAVALAGGLVIPRIEIPYEWAQNGFDLAISLALGGGAHALLLARKYRQDVKLFKEAITDRKNRHNGRNT